MIELYVILTLIGIGYVLNQNKTNKINLTRKVNKGDISSATNPYHQDFKKIVDKTEGRLSNKMNNKLVNEIAKAKDNKNTEYKRPPVVGKGFGNLHNLYRSPLADQPVEMRHNNMIPFGNVKQNVDIDGNKNILEHMNGTDKFYKSKTECAPLFKPESGITNIYGNEVPIESNLQYFNKPKVKNNVLPFDQIRVGPGLDEGFTSEPSGGFHQENSREYSMPKTTNELRVADKPKVTFKGRIVDGIKSKLPGKHGKVQKNRVDTSYEQNPDMYLKTTGAVIKDTHRSEYDVKFTNRNETLAEYKGNIYKANGDQKRPLVKETNKSQYDGFDFTNLTQTRVGKESDDHGKASIMVYKNERDITQTNTYQGGLTSIVKAIIAPLQDIVKVAKKEYTVDNPRPYGSLMPQLPSKATVFDPNDTSRTTVKETLIHDADRLNLKGSIKTTVLDSDQVARTTIKETNIHDADNLNIKGPIKLTIYDPNDVARVTMKELLIHDTVTGPIKPLQYFGGVYNDQSANATIRETLDANDTSVNFKPSVLKATVHDPNDTLRTTNKETLIDSQDGLGFVERTDRQLGAYVDEFYDVKKTQKEIFSDVEYSGNPNLKNTDGYKVANMIPKVTQKEFLSDNEYIGNIADQSAKQMMSYDDIYNATINELREGTLIGRDPTQTSVKSAISGSDINMENRRQPLDEPSERNILNPKTTNQNILIPDQDSITKRRNEYVIDDRLNDGQLDQLKDNPYVLSQHVQSQ